MNLTSTECPATKEEYDSIICQYSKEDCLKSGLPIDHLVFKKYDDIGHAIQDGVHMVTKEDLALCPTIEDVQKALDNNMFYFDDVTFDSIFCRANELSFSDTRFVQVSNVTEVDLDTALINSGSCYIFSRFLRDCYQFDNHISLTPVDAIEHRHNQFSVGMTVENNKIGEELNMLQSLYKLWFVNVTIMAPRLGDLRATTTSVDNCVIRRRFVVWRNPNLAKPVVSMLSKDFGYAPYNDNHSNYPCPHLSINELESCIDLWHRPDILKTAGWVARQNIYAKTYMYMASNFKPEINIRDKIFTDFCTGWSFFSSVLSKVSFPVPYDKVESTNPKFYSGSGYRWLYLANDEPFMFFYALSCGTWTTTMYGNSIKRLKKDLVYIGGSYYPPEKIVTCPNCGKKYLKDDVFCSNCQCRTADTGEVRYIKDCFMYTINGCTSWYEHPQTLCTCDLCGTAVPKDDTKTLFNGKYRICKRHNTSCDTMHYGDDTGKIRALISGYHGNDTAIQYALPVKDTDENGNEVNVKLFTLRELANFLHTDRESAKKSFKGFGFELEVDHCQNSDYKESIYNNMMANVLAEDCGFAEEELFFERDGSLNDGFEIISQPHTIEAFWLRKDCWSRMLRELRDGGYHSHNAQTCGLHIHVSKSFFGETERKQNYNIAKIYKFYDEFWPDVQRASRRKDTDFCSKNGMSYKTRTYNSKSERGKTIDWQKQTTSDKRTHHHCNSHHVALNNSHDDTFEFRLGRGTLNELSFFAWVDFTIALTKNCTKSAEKLKDPVEWLRGIKASTAVYLLKKNSFTDAINKLFPDLSFAFNAEGMSDETRA